MIQDYLFEPISCEKFDLLTREELIEFARIEQQFRIALQAENKRLRDLHELAKQRTMLIQDQYVVIKNKIFGKSSEKSAKEKKPDDQGENPKKHKIKIQLPSERYPDAPLIERDIELKDLPACNCCGNRMEDSGMTEDSEFLTVIPKQYIVVRQKRHKYRCVKCHGDIKTAPSIPRIKAGSSYSDEMIVDVAMTKYCDLIPIERYATMAGRDGLENLPPQSLIETSHYLSDFVEEAYNKLKEEISFAKTVHADETPHRMLEGDKKTNWFLWGFSTKKTSYFEIHDTRSGVIASDLLEKSQCEYLISDVFSGYDKAVRDANRYRRENNLPMIKNAYCNSHARRKFKEAELNFAEARYFIDRYQEIYFLETEAQELPPDEKLKCRGKMEFYFKEMELKAMTERNAYPAKSSMGKAIGYFLKNYDELTLFIKIAEIAIDNNSQERLLRSPVIGRKTWYGTHSRRGAKTAAIFFSLVESCKLNKINPREYFKNLIEDLHQGKPAYTPAEYQKSCN